MARSSSATADPVDEFEQQRGEIQRRGNRRVLGLGAPREPSVVGIAPPANLQVQSVFDTRPIAAYDFAISDSVDFGGLNSSSAAIQVEVPDGYTAVLRRVELEIVPALLYDGLDGADIFLTRDDSAIPNNDVRLRAAFTSYTWDTHQVFGFWQRFGVRLICGVAPPVVPEPKLTVRFFGVLIPSRSLPYPDEIASGPVVTIEDTKP